MGVPASDVLVDGTLDKVTRLYNCETGAEKFSRLIGKRGRLLTPRPTEGQS
jgi:hypothetical protein